MTTVFQEPITCAVCGRVGEQVMIGSTNTLGAYDLDFRPPQMQRGTMEYWVQRCGFCGYCSEDIGAEVTGAWKWVGSLSYKLIFWRGYVPELARKFECEAFILERDREIYSAGLVLLCAAWVCDDAGKVRLARGYRRRAARLLILARETDLDLDRDPLHEGLVLVDVLRRAGEFGRALKYLLDYQKMVSDVDNIFEFQKRLIFVKNTGGFTFEDVEHTQVESLSRSACRKLLPLTLERIWARGAGYAVGGLISVMKMDDKKIIATATGTDVYSVKASMNSKKIKFSCTCPYTGAKVCKHIAAAAIVWDEKRGITPPGEHEVRLKALRHEMWESKEMRDAGMRGDGEMSVLDDGE